MYPIILKFNAFSLFGMSIGPIKIYTYGVMMALGFLTAFYYLNKVCKKYGISKVDTMDCMIVMVVCGILGARLNYVALNIGYFSNNPFKIFAINEGGLVYYGGFLLALIGALIFIKVKNIIAIDLLDALAPALPLGHTFGRIGCFFNGCCYGRPTDSPIGIVFPNTPGNLPRLPTQLIEAFFNVFLFYVLARLSTKTRKKGIVFSLYLVVYPVFRYINEILRGDFIERGGHFFLKFTFSQTISLSVFLIGIISLVFRIRKNELRPAVIES